MEKIKCFKQIYTTIEIQNLALFRGFNLPIFLPQVQSIYCSRNLWLKSVSKILWNSIVQKYWEEIHDWMQSQDDFKAAKMLTKKRIALKIESGYGLSFEIFSFFPTYHMSQYLFLKVAISAGRIFKYIVQQVEWQSRLMRPSIILEIWVQN